MTIALSELLASARSEHGALVVDVPADWMQGRSVFGGLQAAFALRAMRELVPHAPLRSLQTTFIAPVAGAMRAAARVLRTGKNAAQVEARIGDPAAPQAIVIGVFGTARSSAVARALAPRALPPGAAPVFELPFGTAGIADFIQHFQVRCWRGQLPFSGGRESEQIMDVAIDDGGSASEASVIAVADFMPPIAFSQLSAPAAGSTLSWLLELLAERFDHVPNAGFRIEAEMIAARDGYTNQAVRLFAASGTPLALGHQTMLVFG